MYKRKWTLDSLATALTLSADVGIKEAAKTIGVSTSALGQAFSYYGLSVREARDAVNDNVPVVKVSLGRGGFEKPMAWAIPLLAWCPAAARLDKQPHGCRWISGHPLGDSPYCGAEKAANSNFCSEHKKVSKRPKKILTFVQKK